MDYIERLEKSLVELEEGAGKLSNIPELIHAISELITIYKDGTNTIEQSGERMSELENALSEKIDELEVAVKKEQESRDELINSIRTTLTSNNREQIEAVNSVTTLVNNKVAVVESNLGVKIAEIDNESKKLFGVVQENSNKADTIALGVAGVGDKVMKVGEETAANIEELKQFIPLVKRVQILSIIGIVIAVIGCILGIVM